MVAKQGNRVSLKNRKQKAGASRLSAFTAGMLVGLTPLLSAPAAAADAAEVAMVIDAVRGKYPPPLPSDQWRKAPGVGERETPPPPPPPWLAGGCRVWVEQWR